ncbi:hypothetical protein [Desulfonatronum parangueonense]
MIRHQKPTDQIENITTGMVSHLQPLFVFYTSPLHESTDLRLLKTGACRTPARQDPKPVRKHLPISTATNQKPEQLKAHLVKTTPARLRGYAWSGDGKKVIPAKAEIQVMLVSSLC